MKLSIFTPTHNPKHLQETYNSIKDQDFYEWIILAQGCQVPDFKDKRVKLFEYPKLGDHYVGALKKECCRLASGDILLELDHDDLLLPNAVQEVKEAFKDKEIGFVYSNCARFKGDFEKDQRYDEKHGWIYSQVEYKGHLLEEPISFPPTAASVSRVWYAPDHLRAWRKSIYDEIGGHLDNTRVLDDHELLIRTYLATKMKHLNKCLYLYRITGDNTWLRFNGEIQTGTVRLYDQYIEKLAKREADLRGLKSLDLGGRFNSHQGFTTVDLKDADVIADLSKKWPFKDNSVGVIIANDFLEHIEDKLHVIKEIYRVLAPGGYLLSMTPSTDGRGAFQDPTHVAYYNENSFLYYTNKNWAQYIDTPVRFQDTKIYTTEKNAQGVSWVVAHLISLKDNYRPPGLINI